MLSLQLEREVPKVASEPVQDNTRRVRVYRKMTSAEERQVDLFDRAREIFVRARIQRRYRSSSGGII
jgi:hypothetical protein